MTHNQLQVKEVLAHIEAGGLLPPLVVLQALAANPALKLSVVKGYAARTLAAEAAAVDEDRKVIGRFQEETAAMRAEINELKTKVRAIVFVGIRFMAWKPQCPATPFSHRDNLKTEAHDGADYSSSDLSRRQLTNTRNNFLMIHR